MTAGEITHVLSFVVEALTFVCFRQPTSTSTVLTYPVPPFTTVRGLVANCIGRPRDDFSLQEAMAIGIEPVRHGTKNRELARLLKFNDPPKTFKRYFPSSPMFKEFLSKPVFRIYLFGSHELLQEIHSRVLDPERPLYLGQSDDLADISEVQPPSQVVEVQNNVVHSVVEGIGEGGTAVKLPYRFGADGNTLIYAGAPPHIFSVPLTAQGIRFSTPKAVYRVGDRYVAAY